MTSWWLLDHACGCPDRSPVFPVLLQTEAVVAGDLYPVYLHRTREGSWARCPDRNSLSKPDLGRGGEERAVVLTLLRQSTDLVCAEMNKLDGAYWRHELATACRQEVENRVALRDRVAGMLDGQEDQLRRARCRLAVIEAHLSLEAESAAWALLADWRGTGDQLVESARALAT